MRKILKCAYCNSTDVYVLGSLYWNKNNQDWDIGSAFSEYFCNCCCKELHEDGIIWNEY